MTILWLLPYSYFFSNASIHPSNFIDVSVAVCCINIWKALYQRCSYQHIEHHVYHSYMVMIFIVQSINMSSQGKKFTIGHKVSCTTIITLCQGLHMVQIWTPLQVFSNGYVYTDKFQLPLYNGIPNKVNCYSYKA